MTAPLTAGQVETYRREIGVGPDFTVDPDAMERLADFYDQLAGPYRLTPEERWVHRACRERFGLYDPTDVGQLAFIRHLRLEAEMWVDRVVVHPRQTVEPLPVAEPVAEAPILELWAQLFEEKKAA